jgi:hypothetical protein
LGPLLEDFPRLVELQPVQQAVAAGLQQRHDRVGFGLGRRRVVAQAGAAA